MPFAHVSSMRLLKTEAFLDIIQVIQDTFLAESNFDVWRNSPDFIPVFVSALREIGNNTRAKKVFAVSVCIRRLDFSVPPFLHVEIAIPVVHVIADLTGKRAAVRTMKAHF